MSDDATASAVGQQLARRREELDLTQDDLAKRIGVSGRTVSAIERGVNSIQRKNRPAWEKALGLARGTIHRAYQDGMPVELVSTPADAWASSDDVVASLVARVKRMEERLDEEGRAREALERKVAELSMAPTSDPAERELPRST